ncbi:MAG: ribose-5-phosphate isomerase RpiA [Atopostipes suicloacalis]|nr:ribose-5-phosphate isomerase RpiA [Atopostipes suicloacalis]
MEMNQKQQVGEKAATFIEDKMTVGLGTGSTARYMVEALAKRVKEENLTIDCVATSIATFDLAKSLGLNIKELSEVGEIDLTIDGADEVSPDFQGIKGGGAAHLFEKIVATRSKKNIWIVDDSKLVDTLGAFPLPVEVVQFGSDYLFNQFKEANYQPSFRLDDEGKKLLTDSGNYIIDLALKEIKHPKKLAAELKAMVGVVEQGLFIDIVDQVIVGNSQGEVEIKTK